MRTASKIAAKDSCNFALNRGNSNETNIKVTPEIAALFGNVPNPGESFDVSFYIEKGDFLRCLCQILGVLPLYNNKGQLVTFSEQLFQDKTKAIYNFFGDENTREIKAKLTKPGSHPICLNFGANNFSIRDFLVESRSLLTFTENNGKVRLNVKYEDYSSVPVELNNDDGQRLIQRIIYGAPGTGKSFSIKTVIANHLGVIPDKIDMEADYIFRTTFHPDYDYAQFVGCYKPIKPENADITYEFTPQVFTNALMKSYETNNPVYLVIEEINRGNCAQIFGDLFQLLDRNSQTGVSEYSINADEDMKIYLEKHCPNAIKDGKIKLPGNFNIIATMNTSDQSLFPMDSAFKRRWEWVYEPIKYDTKFVIKVDDKHEYNWCDFQRKVNQKILDKTFSEDKQMGDFFIKTDVTLDNFINKVMFYLWNDICKENYRTDDNFFRTKDEKSEDTPEFSFGELMNDKLNKVVGFMDYLGVANSKKSLIENPQSGNDTSDGVVEA